ncbi:MAG: hypothetical protein IH845_05335 [Nanoarchaeota archaeon]|nr:hypothetical protein [Nanoarchaeota archaeon]
MNEQKLSDEIINARSCQLTDKVIRVPKVRKALRRLKQEIDLEIIRGLSRTKIRNRMFYLIDEIMGYKLI